MMLTILDIVKNNKILLIDEIETQLHIKLVEYIIGLFNKSESAQLIYTTHNTYLLNTNKLRKDQIYLLTNGMTGPRICIRCLITKISVTGWMQKRHICKVVLMPSRILTNRRIIL